MNMDFDKLRTLPGTTQEEFDQLREGILAMGKSELYGSWVVETEQERKLRELAETYHTGCEAYAKRVCSGTSPRTGEAIPVTPDEMHLINRHVLQMRNTMIAEGERLGFSPRQIEEAIRKWVMNHAD